MKEKCLVAQLPVCRMVHWALKSQKLEETGSRQPLEGTPIGLDAGKVDPAILLGVMQSASAQEIPSFTDEYIHSVEEALGSKPFCQYLMLSVRFTADRFAASLGVGRQEAFAPLTCLDLVGRNVTAADLKSYFSAILLRMVELRDQASSSQCRQLLKQAMAYIDNHFTEESLSLNQAARAKGYKDILDVDFDIIVTYESGLVVTVDKICCASITELPSGMKEGDAQAEISLPFVALDVEYDTAA